MNIEQTPNTFMGQFSLVSQNFRFTVHKIKNPFKIVYIIGSQADAREHINAIEGLKNARQAIVTVCADTKNARRALDASGSTKCGNY